MTNPRQPGKGVNDRTGYWNIRGSLNGAYQYWSIHAGRDRTGKMDTQK